MSDAHDPTPDPEAVAELVALARMYGPDAWTRDQSGWWRHPSAAKAKHILLDSCDADVDVIDAALDTFGPWWCYPPADAPAALLLQLVEKEARWEFRHRRNRLLKLFAGEAEDRYDKLTHAEVEAAHAVIDHQARRRAA